MKKVLKIVQLKDRTSDYEYWITKTPKERLEALEMLRQHHINFNKDAWQGFQRVCRIINKKKG